MSEKWIYSEREDLYWEYSEEFDTKEQAIESAKEDEEIECSTVFIGKKTEPAICGIDIDSILENIAEGSTIGLDGYGEDFLEDISKEHLDELEDKLNNVFLEWMNKHNYNPTWFEVIDVEEVDL